MWILYAVGGFASPIASFGLFLTAVIVLALTHGRTGLGDLFRKWFAGVSGLGWYAVALSLPVALTASCRGVDDTILD